MKFRSCLLIFLSVTSSVVRSEQESGQMGYGETCFKTMDPEKPFEDEEDNCDPELNLQCDGDTKTCKCRRSSWYDEKSNSCFPLIGGECQPLGKCVANAVCVESSNIWSFPEHIYKIITDFHQSHRPIFSTRQRRHVSRCSKGFRTAEGLKACVPALQYEDKCTEEMAKKNLTCDFNLGLNCSSSGTCECKDPTTMIFNPAMHQCVIKVGSPCGNNHNRFTKCDRNSICPNTLMDLKSMAAIVRTGRDRHHYYEQELYYAAKLKKKQRCECFPGYVQNSKGECVASYHVPCSTESPCDKEKFLACVNGICQCERGATEVFEGDRMICKLQLGTPCTEKKGPKCMLHAICKKGRCECSEGFSEASLTSCLANQGSKCTTPYACNNVRGLACIDSKCTCFDPTFKWNSKAKMCAAEEGGFCGKFNLNQSDVVEKMKMDDDLYPEVPSGMPPFYLIGCEEGSKCTADHQVWGHGLSRCKKAER